MSSTTVVVDSEPAVAVGQKQAERDPLKMAPTVKAADRLLSLDVFRGITIAGMVLVNNPQSIRLCGPVLMSSSLREWRCSCSASVTG
jgi:uncharacterized membrane protein YeiB